MHDTFVRHATDMSSTRVNRKEITCVLFDDAANLLLGLTAEQLIVKSLSEGPDDPCWIYEFLMDTLCAQHVIFRIKVDEYNLAPTYSPRFTVSKYLGDEINNLATTTLPSTCPSADVLHDETTEYLARINDDEWDMVHESLWGPRVSPTQSKTSTSSVIVDMEHEVDYDISKFPPTNDAKNTPNLSDADQTTNQQEETTSSVVDNVEREVDTDISKCPAVDDARCTPNSSYVHTAASQQESMVVDVNHEVASVDDAKNTPSLTNGHHASSQQVEKRPSLRLKRTIQKPKN
ncbi:hypothetical protein HanHA300_Chr08g0286171 [Helianthus annuus]|nr:hypothetical protein HanHA300_Chr08g0286171 [Helianthus annuus]KAJ0554127.1 hypothetical protein HanHA89_Chr08g0304171 [Helianthus annuus]KAJ0719732.1 hypothetical protein HanLR1_Chr08g0285011 [Helianthus annuus]